MRESECARERMKLITPEIAWHGRDGGKNDPILSCHWHPRHKNVFITSGGDAEIKLWRLSSAFFEDHTGNDSSGSGASSSTSDVNKSGVANNCGRRNSNVPSLKAKDGSGKVVYVTGLKGHLKTVNAARFSPDGGRIASCSDDGTVQLWSLSGHGIGARGADFGWSKVRSDSDVSRRLLRGHGADVYDLAWSPDSSAILSGSVDNTAIVWDVALNEGSGSGGGEVDGGNANREIFQMLKGHSHYVQGVAWDPFQQFAVTQSSDKSCRVYALPGRSSGCPPPQIHSSVPEEDLLLSSSAGVSASGVVKGSAPLSFPLPKPASKRALTLCGTLRKRVLPTPVAGGESDNHHLPPPPPSHLSGSGASSSKRRGKGMFFDETVPTFVRRPCWSPDGSLLFVPTGYFKDKSASAAAVSSSSGKGGKTTVQPTTYAFLRGQWQNPVFHLPGPPGSDPSICVRCCPTLFELTTRKGRRRRRRGKGGDSAPPSSSKKRKRGQQEGPAGAEIQEEEKGGEGKEELKAEKITAETNVENRHEGNDEEWEEYEEVFPRPYVSLPYRIIFAIATLGTVTIYDTQRPTPVAYIEGAHYAQINDLAWVSHDEGWTQRMIIASADGYCR